MPDDRTLMQSQKNDVLPILDAVGLPAAAFRWLEEIGVWTVSRLEHLDSGYYYVFDWSYNQDEMLAPFARYSPGRETREETAFVNGWDGHCRYVESWATFLAREVSSPDLWSATQQLASDAALIQDNLPFTADEIHEIGEQLREIRKAIRDLKELSLEQSALLDKRLKYLETAAGRVGRFDWRGLVVSQILQIAWDLAFNPAQARTLYELFAAALVAVGQAHALPRLLP